MLRLNRRCRRTPYHVLSICVSVHSLPLLVISSYLSAFFSSFLSVFYIACSPFVSDCILCHFCPFAVLECLAGLANKLHEQDPVLVQLVDDWLFKGVVVRALDDTLAAGSRATCIETAFWVSNLQFVTPVFFTPAASFHHLHPHLFFEHICAFCACSHYHCISSMYSSSVCVWACSDSVWLVGLALISLFLFPCSHSLFRTGRARARVARAPRG